MNDTFEIFLSGTPGLEQVLRDEALENGFAGAQVVPGGVQFQGGWVDVWRANLCLRGPTRVLARIGGFPVFHLAQLDKRARKFAWDAVLPKGAPLRVEVTCKRSKIYHDRAARQRIETALKESFGATLGGEDALQLRARIEDNFCTFSLDTSGESLHKRGHKSAVGKAPMRETLAAMFLRQCGYSGVEPVLDPMCGSGTFVIEAAEIAMGLAPGRSRAFAFEQFPRFDPATWEALKAAATPRETDQRFFGSDRDAGAVTMATANAKRAGVDAIAIFSHHAVSDLQRPDGPPGLVIVNPPYGGRIGNKKLLYAIHGTLGQVLKERFTGWRAAIITNEADLAHATGLPFLKPGPPIPHGGLKVKLYQTAPLP